MPRIALLFEYPTLNGGERSMLAVVDQLSSDSEFEFIAIAPEVGPLAEALAEREFDVLPLRIHDEDGRRLAPKVAADRLRDTLQTCNADLLHANSLAMGRLTGALGDDVPIPRVAHLRDIIKLSAAAIADLNRNDQLIAVSQATRAFHVTQNLDASRTQVIHNGIPKPAGCTRPDPPGHSRAALGIPDDAFVVLTVGQIGLRKGQDVLAEAAVVLERTCETASVRMCYLIVGERNSTKPESIAFEANVRQHFIDADLGDRLHMPGYRDDVPQLMREADLLVHPAKQEPLGRVLLEAAAAGLPIVATDVGGTSEILEDGVSARLVPPNDPVALANAILGLAAAPSLRTQFAIAARERVADSFDIATAAKRLVEIWRQAISKGGGDAAIESR